MKVDELEIKWKGLFFLIAWFYFMIRALLDAALQFTAITLIIVSLILISSSI